MHGKNYREIKGMAYTSKQFAPGAPNPKVARFTVGNSRGEYDFVLQLVSSGRVQIRHNALEAARVAANKKLALVGEDNYYLIVKTYPHIILRENKMIATAGADRLQEGMRKAFGKPIGLAARVSIGEPILELRIKKESLQKGKEALSAASTKLPMKTKVIERPMQQPVAK
jgi:large subunit ribosomal protein L10e